MIVIGLDEKAISWLSQCYVGPSLCVSNDGFDSIVMYCIFRNLTNWSSFLPSDVGHQATVLIGSCGWSRSDAEAEQNLQKAIARKDVDAIEAAPRWSRGELKSIKI